MKLELIYAQDVRLLRWAESKLGHSLGDRARWIAGLDAELASVVFVVVFNDFCDRNCQMTIATDATKRWASRRTLRAVFSAPFIQWKLARVTFVVASTNAPSLSLCERLGAQREGRIRGLFAEDADGIVFGLLKSEAQRWLAPGVTVSDRIPVFREGVFRQGVH